MLAAIPFKSSPARKLEKRQHAQRKRFVKAWKHWNDIHGGALKVPENYNNPSGRHIYLAYAVLRKKKKQVQRPPILVLSGGPGISALQGIPFWLNSSLREEHDVILVDQRGTDYSSALPNVAPHFLEMMAGEYSAEEECARVHQIMAQFLDDPRLAKTDLSAYQPYQNVRDFERLMRHLGYEQYHLLGLSHGTKLAMILADRCPEKVKSIVQYGPWTTCSRYFQHLPQNFSDAWDWFVTYGKDKGLKCQKTAFIEALQRVRQQPVEMKLKGKAFLLHERDLLYFLRYYLYFPNADQTVPAFFEALKKGDTRRLQFLSRRPLRMVLGEINLTTYAASLAFDESEQGSTEDLEVLCRNNEFFQPGLSFFPAFARHLNLWRKTQASREQRMLQPTDIPSLILVHEGDPVTPPWQGVRMQGMLQNSELMRFSECGHVFLDEQKFAIMRTFFSAQ